MTIKLGAEDLSIVGRDTHTNQTFSATLRPKDAWERFFKEIEKHPEVGVKWE